MQKCELSYMSNEEATIILTGDTPPSIPLSDTVEMDTSTLWWLRFASSVPSPEQDHEFYKALKDLTENDD